MSAAELALDELEALNPVLPPPDWTRALCAQADPEAWFPEPGGAVGPAKRVCRRCGIRPECLAYAVATLQQHGVWGGLTPRERRRLTAPADRAGVS